MRKARVFVGTRESIWKWELYIFLEKDKRWTLLKFLTNMSRILWCLILVLIGQKTMFMFQPKLICFTTLYNFVQTTYMLFHWTQNCRRFTIKVLLAGSRNGEWSFELTALSAICSHYKDISKVLYCHHSWIPSVGILTSKVTWIFQIYRRFIQSAHASYKVLYNISCYHFFVFYEQKIYEQRELMVEF